MTSLRRLLAFLVLGVILVAAGGLATGRIAHVTTTGVSMEPTYSAGDLVLIARSDSYEVGDIVAFRIPGDDTLVLHRIIGGDDSGFTIRGDNNESIDPYQPTADEILGRELLHVPRIGALLTSPLVRGALLVPVFILLGVMTMSPKRGATTERPPTTHERGRMARLGWKLLLAVDVVLLAALGAVQIAGSDGDPEADVAEPMQTAELRYHADVDVSDTYPDGSITTGDPVFTSLVERVGITFRHTTEASGTVTGTAGLDVALSTASGWESTRELIEPTEFDSGGAELDETLVLPQIVSLVERVAEATGVPAGTISIVVTASGEASLDGAEPEPFSVDLPMQLSPASLTLTGEATEAAGEAAVVSTSPLVGESETDLPEGGARDLRTPLLVALLVAMAATAALWPTSDDEDQEDPVIAHTRRVQVPSTTARIQVNDREELRAIASTVGRPVVTAVGWEGVLTADALYWYETSAPETETGTATSPDAGVPSPPSNSVVHNGEPVHAATR